MYFLYSIDVVGCMCAGCIARVQHFRYNPTRFHYGNSTGGSRIEFDSLKFKSNRFFSKKCFTDYISLL